MYISEIIFVILYTPIALFFLLFHENLRGFSKILMSVEYVNSGGFFTPVVGNFKLQTKYLKVVLEIFILNSVQKIYKFLFQFFSNFDDILVGFFK